MALATKINTAGAPLLTRVTTTESLTGWSAIGSGQAGLAADVNFFAQGTVCVSKQITGAGTNKGQWFDNGTPIDLTGQHVFIWMYCTTPNLIDTFAAGGIRLRLGTDINNWSEWYVGGSDYYREGWVKFVIDPSLTQSTGAGTFDLTNCQWFGGTLLTTGTIRGVNFGIDAIEYGTGYQIDGTSTANDAWGDIILNDEGTIANRYGLVREDNGIIFAQGHIQLGSNTTIATTLSDINKTIVFEDPLYHNTTAAVSAVGAGFNKLTFSGNATGASSYTFGTKSGTGAAALGYDGVTFKSAGGALVSVDAANIDIGTFAMNAVQFNDTDIIDLGSITVALGATTTITEFIDCSFSNNARITKNFAATVGNTLLINNKIVNNTDLTASLSLVDEVLVNAGGTLSIVNNDGFTSLNDAVVSTIEVLNHNFSGLVTWVELFNSKTWRLVNPEGAFVLGDFLFTGTTSNSVEIETSVDILSRDTDAVPVQDVQARIYDAATASIKHLGTARGDTGAGVQYTNASGIVAGYIQQDHIVSGALTTYGPFTGKITHYDYFPQTEVTLAATAVDLIDVIHVMLDDPNVVLTKAAALALGTPPVLVQETNPSSLIAYDVGSVIFVLGETITGAGGATGTVSEVIGDLTSGVLLVTGRNATAFVDNEALTGGTQGVAQADLATKNQAFKWTVDCNGHSLSAVYDYAKAKLSETTLSAAWENYLERAGGTTLLYLGPSGYYTSRVHATDGVYLFDRGAGAVDYLTADDNTTYTPPTAVQLEINGVTATLTACAMFAAAGGPETIGTELMNEFSDGTGKAVQAYQYQGSEQPVTVRARLAGYKPFLTTGTITANGLTVTAVWQVDPNYSV
jgi:hypothetical protein